MHGANDLNNKRPISGVIGALEQMIGEAQRRGIAVIVASLPPQNPEGSRGNGAEALPEFSRRVRAMAADEGAIFLDLFNLMGTYVGYIGVDGLHPTPTGYQRIARALAGRNPAPLRGHRQARSPAGRPVRPG